MVPGGVEVIDSKGCSKLLVGASGSIPHWNSSRPSDFMSQASSVPKVATEEPFKGLIICVTGLSKEARKQVMSATQKLGGKYSASLHSQCTHLVVQSFSGRKFEHATKHGFKTGLYVVTLGWFIDSVRRNFRLNESLYGVRSVKENGFPLHQFAEYTTSEKSCLPAALLEENRPSNSTPQSNLHFSHKASKISGTPVLANEYIYIDSNISVSLKNKVVDTITGEGAKLLDHWFSGCQASHVVCESPHLQKYLGYTTNLVTPLWILKTVKEKHVHRLVHLSSDLARHVALLLENSQDMTEQNDCEISIHPKNPLTNGETKKILQNREEIADLAKTGVRNRRRLRMQSCHMPLHPITPSSLLDSISWSISEPTSSAGIYTDTAGTDDACQTERTQRRDTEVSFDNLSRPLKESEKVEVIFKSYFLSILFPIDRFGELGPSSRTFFKEKGFTCLQVLDLIYNFYQENLTNDEVGVAIHTDSRHGDRLRSIYTGKESINNGFVALKRIEFLGSRRSFEGLKRVSGENRSNVYELVIRA